MTVPNTISLSYLILCIHLISWFIVTNGQDIRQHRMFCSNLSGCHCLGRSCAFEALYIVYSCNERDNKDINFAGEFCVMVHHDAERSLLWAGRATCDRPPGLSSIQSFARMNPFFHCERTWRLKALSSEPEELWHCSLYLCQWSLSDVSELRALNFPSRAGRL